MTAEFQPLPYPVIIDSGAAESVLPQTWCPQAGLTESKLAGSSYTAANGLAIQNSGGKTVSMVTKEGLWRDMTFQVCDVARPLASVHKIVEAGHSVVFSPSWGGRGSYILNQGTGEKLWMVQKHGVYVLETKIAPREWQAKPSFTRQGR